MSKKATDCIYFEAAGGPGEILLHYQEKAVGGGGSQVLTGTFEKVK